MKIDFSKISQDQLDSMIKEEALKIRARLLSESKKKAKINQLREAQEALTQELEELEDVEEGMLGNLFKKNNGDEKRKQTVLSLLKHPYKKVELLTYASPEQMEQFKSYLPDEHKDYVDFTVKTSVGAKKQNDPNRAESYINFFQNGGGKSLNWDEAKREYVDSTKVAGRASTAFAEGKNKTTR